MQDFEFENQKGLKLKANSVTLFPVLLVILIAEIIVAYKLRVAYAYVYVFFILYFLRSSLFREIRKKENKGKKER